MERVREMLGNVQETVVLTAPEFMTSMKVTSTSHWYHDVCFKLSSSIYLCEIFLCYSTYWQFIELLCMLVLSPSLFPAVHHFYYFFSHPPLTLFPSQSLLFSELIHNIVSRQLYVENSVARSIILRPLLQEVTSVQRKMVRAHVQTTTFMFKTHMWTDLGAGTFIQSITFMLSSPVIFITIASSDDNSNIIDP